MEFLVAFALLSVVVYGRFFIRARQARAYNLLAQRQNLLTEREADQKDVWNAFIHYEITRERLYYALEVPYVQNTYLQPHFVEMVEARDKASGDPDTPSPVRMVIDSHEMADRAYHLVCAEWDIKYPGISARGPLTT